jgi:Holliday junction resolvasome RuvABC endonuclease subunit
MTTLAIDLGQHMGWCRGNAVGPLEHGTFEMPDTTDLGRWLAGSDRFFMEMLPGVDTVAIEQPFMSDSIYPIRKLLAALGHCHYHWHVLGRSSSLIEEIPVSTGKLTLAGKGHAEAHEMIYAACEFFGFEHAEIDEHQAHAMGLFKVHLFGRIEPPNRRRSRSGPGRSILRS